MAKVCFGLPYIGGKGLYAQEIVDLLPAADHLCDVFCGGCAVTHCALLSRKWLAVHASDISDMATVFRDACLGRYDNESRVIDRDTFRAIKDTDAVARLCWSFGSGGYTYAYGRPVEALEQAVAGTILSSTPEERWRWLSRMMAEADAAGRRPVISHGSGAVTRLLRFRALSGTDVSRLTTAQVSYEEAPIPKGAVIYCDPPYVNSDRRCYGGNFDYGKFYEWCLAQERVFISERSMPDAFTPIWSRRKSNFGNPGNDIDRLYIPAAHHAQWAEEHPQWQEGRLI